MKSVFIVFQIKAPKRRFRIVSSCAFYTTHNVIYVAACAHFVPEKVRCATISVQLKSAKFVDIPTDFALRQNGEGGI